MSEVIHAWSGPRSLSTSLMYSFAQRDDTEVMDEPLYAHFLKVTGVERPYRKQLLSQMETDGNEVVHKIIYGPCNKKYRYCKSSFDDVIPASMDELDFPCLVALYVDLKQRGSPPPIINALDLQRNSEGILRALCKSLGINFQASMLKWIAGPRPEDGIWAPWWYKSVHKSTGFDAPPLYPGKVFPFQLYELLEECCPFYNVLRSHALKPDCDNTKLYSPSLPVPKNRKILVWVGDEIVPHDDAKGGDGVWEGLRIYNGKIFKLDNHLDRLFASAKALAFVNLPTREEVKHAIFTTLILNGMNDGAHVRLTLTHGKKVTSGMSPAFNLYGCNLIVLAEWKPPVYNNSEGVRLRIASTRRNSPNCLDSKIHHNNLLNNILVKIEGNLAKADDAIMLDCEAFVSETNSTNLFLVKKGQVLTPHADYCLPGITCKTVIKVVQNEGLMIQEKRLTVAEFRTADEVWTTGTMGELTPVVEIDGHIIGDGQVGTITMQIQGAYSRLTEMEGEPIPFPEKP